MSITPTAAAPPQIDRDEIRRAIEILIEPDALVEVRLLISKNRVVSGYYKNDVAGMEALLADVELWSKKRNPKDQPESLYITLNRIDPLLHARAYNQAKDYAKLSTADHDVTWRRWFLVDVDSKRPAGVSSPEIQHTEALAVAGRIADFLEARGIPCVRADSGNGGHNLFALDLPNGDAEKALLDRVLKALAHCFDNDVVKVDLTTFNASRIAKLYGTAAMKGDSTLHQPHRLARILSVPNDLRPATVEQLQAIAALLPQQDSTSSQRQTKARSSFDIETFVADHFGEIASTSYKGGKKWVLPECPFNPDHKEPDAAIFEGSDGKLGFRCLHNSCAGFDWHALRDKFEPNGHQRDNGYERPPHPADVVQPAADSQRPAEAINSFSSFCSYSEEADFQPPELAPEAYHGIVGTITRAIEPHTESDPAAVLTFLIGGIGSIIGRGPHMILDGMRHGLNFFFLHVGETAKGRKGTAAARGKQVLVPVDPNWAARIRSGLSTGEGLIAYVQGQTNEEEDELNEQNTYAGVHDRRTFITESEFASVLRVMDRPGNTLGPVLRQAWDGTTLSTMTRKDPLEAVDPHISIVGHISDDELRARLTATEMASGTMNRFVLISVRRSKYLPRGGGEVEGLAALVSRLHARVLKARRIGLVDFDEAAGAVWERLYKKQPDGRPGLSDGQPGLFGAVIGRAEPQVCRLALFYASMDGKSLIGIPHLLAGLAVWDRAEAGASHVFGSAMGDNRADRILAALSERGVGGFLTGREIHDLFGRNDSAGVTAALSLLLRYRRVEQRSMSTGERGRPTVVWSLRETDGKVADHSWLALAKEICASLGLSSEYEQNEENELNTPVNQRETLNL